MKACFLGFDGFHKHYQISEVHGATVEIQQIDLISKTNGIETSERFERRTREFTREKIAFPGDEIVEVFIEVGMKDKSLFQWIFYWEVISLEPATIIFEPCYGDWSSTTSRRDP